MGFAWKPTVATGRDGPRNFRSCKQQQDASLRKGVGHRFRGEKTTLVQPFTRVRFFRVFRSSVWKHRGFEFMRLCICVDLFVLGDCVGPPQSMTTDVRARRTPVQSQIRVRRSCLRTPPRVKSLKEARPFSFPPGLLETIKQTVDGPCLG